MIEAPPRPAMARVRLATLSRGGPVLVLAPHPDDESLGCGALLAAAFAGPGAHVVCMTDGGASHPGSRLWPRWRLARLRAEELDAAVIALGGRPRDITRLGLPDAAMPDSPDALEALTGRIAGLAGRLGARSIFAPAPDDPHCDHVTTHRIATLAARRAGLGHFSYPIWSRWSDPGFRKGLAPGTGHRFGTAPFRDRKARAIACHRSQLGLVVRDDPDGFVMERAFVALFRDCDEIFFERNPQ